MINITEIFRKNKLPAAAFSLFLMIVAAFSILFCEDEIRNLENKWRSLYELKEGWGYEDYKTVAGGQPRDLTGYDIKVSLTRFGSPRADIRFCDKYTFILSGDIKPSGVYYRLGQGYEKYVSTVKYSREPGRTMVGFPRLESYIFRFKCDLVEKTVLVYMDGKFMEKVPLGPEPVYNSFGLCILPGRTEAMLNKLEISDPKGGVLFDVDFAPLFFYKLIS